VKASKLTNCPVCSSILIGTVDTDRINDVTIIVKTECLDCGHVYNLTFTHDSSDDTVHNFLNEQVFNLQQKADPNNVLDLGSSASFFQFSDGSSFHDLIENIQRKLEEYGQSIN